MRHAKIISFFKENYLRSYCREPFRLFNLDVFEYELDNTMALYVAVPYIVAHRRNRTAGMLWYGYR